MSMESLVLFAVLLFLSLLALAVRWLNERIRRDIAMRDLKDLFLQSGNSHDRPVQETSEPQKTVRTRAPLSMLISEAARAPEGRRSRGRVRLRNRTDLREGIILVTVLGPCRALEHHED